MARGEVAPTKSNLLALSRELSFAREGFELLDEKRQILVLELMRHVERAKRLQKESDEAVGETYAVIRDAIIGAGRRSLAALSGAVPLLADLRVRSNRLMGIYLPQVELSPLRMEPRYGLGRNPASSDALYRALAKLLPLLGELAEVESIVVRLARELRKTQRRVNALEKLFIPDTEESIKYISDTLEEREREALVVMRIVKERGEREREAALGDMSRTEAVREGTDG